MEKQMFSIGFACQKKHLDLIKDKCHKIPLCNVVSMRRMNNCMSKHDAASDTNYLFEGYSYKFPNQRRNWYLIHLLDMATCMRKVALEISHLSVQNMVIRINDSAQKLAVDTLKGNHVRMPKTMLPATQTSCLKDTHTNFQVNVGISV